MKKKIIYEFPPQLRHAQHNEEKSKLVNKPTLRARTIARPTMKIKDGIMKSANHYNVLEIERYSIILINSPTAKKILQHPTNHTYNSNPRTYEISLLQCNSNILSLT